MTTHQIDTIDITEVERTSPVTGKTVTFLRVTAHCTCGDDSTRFGVAPDERDQIDGMAQRSFWKHQYQATVAERTPAEAAAVEAASAEYRAAEARQQAEINAHVAAQHRHEHSAAGHAQRQAAKDAERRHDNDDAQVVGY